MLKRGSTTNLGRHLSHRENWSILFSSSSSKYRFLSSSFASPSLFIPFRTIPAPPAPVFGFWIFLSGASSPSSSIFLFLSNSVWISASFCLLRFSRFESQSSFSFASVIWISSSTLLVEVSLSFYVEKLKLLQIDPRKKTLKFFFQQNK